MEWGRGDSVSVTEEVLPMALRTSTDLQKPVRHMTPFFERSNCTLSVTRKRDPGLRKMQKRCNQ